MLGLDGHFEVSSGEVADGHLSSPSTHCSGQYGVGEEPLRDASTHHDDVVAHREACSAAADSSQFYMLYHSIGLEYGPAYRPIQQAWRSELRSRSATGMLRTRSLLSGTLLHPADLDGALQLSMLAVDQGSKDPETRLPFTIKAAFLAGGSGQLVAVSPQT